MAMVKSEAGSVLAGRRAASPAGAEPAAG
jgi:hypothetical protein